MMAGRRLSASCTSCSSLNPAVVCVCVCCDNKENKGMSGQRQWVSQAVHIHTLHITQECLCLSDTELTQLHLEQLNNSSQCLEHPIVCRALSLPPSLPLRCSLTLLCADASRPSFAPSALPLFLPASPPGPTLAPPPV